MIQLMTALEYSDVFRHRLTFRCRCFHADIAAKQLVRASRPSSSDTGRPMQATILPHSTQLFILPQRDYYTLVGHTN